MTFQIPSTTQRTTVIGRTGSGKTQGGAFILSKSAFDQIPFVILDFKREAIFNEIELIKELPLYSPDKASQMLNQPGLFIVHPTPGEEEAVDDLLWMIHAHEYCGVFVDEGYMIGKAKSYEAILTQGRSKHIPVISLTQRPSWISRFVFSEADYLMIFRLIDKRDRDIVESFVNFDISKRLPSFNSYWYDVNQEDVVILRPVPDRDWIKREISAKLERLNQRQPSKSFV